MIPVRLPESLQDIFQFSKVVFDGSYGSIINPKFVTQTLLEETPAVEKILQGFLNKDRSYLKNNLSNL